MQPDSPVSNILDGNIQTFWHSSWFPYKKGFPHNLTITLDKTQKIRGLTFTQRNNLHGAIKKSLFVSVQKENGKRSGYTPSKPNTSRKLFFTKPKT